MRCSESSALSKLYSVLQWDLYISLYEILAEYDFHLIQDLWQHLPLLYQSSAQLPNTSSSPLSNPFIWLEPLFLTGYEHANPFVRRFITTVVLAMPSARQDLLRSVVEAKQSEKRRKGRGKPKQKGINILFFITTSFTKILAFININ